MEKKIKGRKRHIVTDTQGHLLHVVVHAGNKHDTSTGAQVFEEAINKYPTLEGVSADSGYKGTTKEYIENVLKKIITISTKIPNTWSILPKRWIVERTFSWFNGFRRLSKDYEYTIKSAETMVMISHLILLLNRIA